MAKTVVGLFNSTSEAEKAKQALVSDGYTSGQMSVMAAGATGSSTSSDSNSTEDSGEGTGIGAKIEHFFSSLMGGDDDAHEHYASGVNQGGALLAVRTEDEDAEEVATWLHEHGARNIDRNANSVNAGGTGSRDTGYAAAATDRGSQTIPVVREELEVGKRTVDRGGVRVYSHTVEKPAQADVTLRDETINVDRRAVDRPATAADFAAGSGKTIEMRAEGEEAVVGKNSRVVEEVVLGKQASERSEQVHDTLRNTEVEVEKIAPGSERGATDTNATRSARG